MPPPPLWKTTLLWNVTALTTPLGACTTGGNRWQHLSKNKAVEFFELGIVSQSKGERQCIHKYMWTGPTIRDGPTDDAKMLEQRSNPWKHKLLGKKNHRGIDLYKRLRRCRLEIFGSEVRQSGLIISFFKKYLFDPAFKRDTRKNSGWFQ